MFAKRFLITRPLLPMALVLLAALVATMLWLQSAAAQDAPAEPADLTVQSGNGRLDISWTAPSGTVTGYEVQYKYTTAPDQVTSNYVNGWQSRTHAGTGTTHAITGLTNGDYKAGTMYYDVRVRAVNGAARSAWVQGTEAPGDVATKLMLMGFFETELRDGNFRGTLRRGNSLRDSEGNLVYVPGLKEYVYEAQDTFPVVAQLDGVAPAGGYTVTLETAGSGENGITVPPSFHIPAGQTRAIVEIPITDDEISELTQWFTLWANVSPSIPVKTVDGTSGPILFGVMDNDQANWRPPFDLDSLTVNGAEASGPTYDGHNRVVRYSATVANDVNTVSMEPEFGTSCVGCLYWSGPSDGALFENYPKGNRKSTVFYLTGGPRTVWMLVTNGKDKHHHALITVSKLSGSDPNDHGQQGATYAIHPDQLKTGPNHDPEILRALPDIRIANPHRIRQIDLFGVFDDPDYDGLTITAASSNENVATVSVVPDYSTMTVSARSQGTSTVTVTAADIRGGRVSDTFVVKVKSPPRALSSLADIAGLKAGAALDVSLSGLFGDADGDPLTIMASSSDEAVATVSAASDQTKLTVRGIREGDATIHVVALDTDGNPALATFDVRVDQGLGQPAATPEPEPESAVSRYDANDDGIIDENEYAQALRDYEARIINYNDLSAVKAAFLAPRVVAPLPDVTIVNENGARDLPLSGVFWDFWGTLTVAAASSDENIATVLMAPDQSQLTVSAGERGRATVVVTASGGSSAASDTFTVTVKASPVVGRAIADVNDLAAGDTQAIPLSGVFQDPDGDAMSLSAASSNDAVATVSMASDVSALTVAGVSGGTATITVTARDSDNNRVRDDFVVKVPSTELSGRLDNRPPTVAAALSDVTIANERGTRQVSLIGVFSDADKDSLSLTAMSSDASKATVSVSSDYASLTVTARARGTATITVSAKDGRGGAVSDTFTVRVKAAPVVASALADVAGLEIGATQQVPLSGVFIDADGDPLSITAVSSDAATATVTVASDGSAFTLAGVAEGTATITVTAQDADGNAVSDAFDVSVVKAPEPAEPVTPNRGPTVSSAITNAVIVNESGTHEVALSGVFDDADNDALTVAAISSNEVVATVSVAADYSALTVAAKSRGTVTISVTADDSKGGTVTDTFTVVVKVAPVVVSALADVVGMTAETDREVSLGSVFSDADGDALTISAASSDDAVVAAFAFQDTLTLVAVADGSATITVTVEDSDGNTVSDAFDVSVVGPPPVVENLRCIAETERVAFLWDAPEWSGGDVYAYDYELTLPDGRTEGGRLIGITLLLRPGTYQAGAQASVSVTTVYELPDESNAASAEETLTCRVK